MKNIIIIGMVFFSALGAVSGSLAQINVKALVKKAKPAVVTLHCYNSKKQEYGGGTGFFISPTHLITDRHVIAQASAIRCVFSDSVEAEIDGVIAEDSSVDLVMLECKSVASRHIPPLKLAKSLPEEGEEIVVIGSPLGLEYTISSGIVSSVRKTSPVGPAIQFTASVSFGSSGSPILNPQGEVIGIASLIMNEGENLNFAAVSSSARNLKIMPLMKFPQWLHKNDKPTALVSGEEAFKNDFIGNYAYGRGVDEMKQKHYKAAINMFGTAVNIEPLNADAWFGLGQALGFENRFAEAADAMEHVIKLRPSSSEGWLYLGKASANSGDAGKAEEAFLVAAKDEETAESAYFSLGELYFQQHRYQKSIDAFTYIVKHGNPVAEVFSDLGECYFKLGNYQESHRALKAALKIDPYDKNALAGIIAVDMELHEFAEGAGYISAALEHSPDDLLFLQSLGEFFLELKKPGDAINLFQRVIELTKKTPNSPQGVIARESYGMALFDAGDKDDAQKVLQILRKLDAKEQKIWRNILQERNNRLLLPEIAARGAAVSVLVSTTTIGIFAVIAMRRELDISTKGILRGMRKGVVK